MIVSRFADDFVVGFQNLGDARQFLRDLRERFAKFNLELHPDSKNGYASCFACQYLY